ncbi:MAG: D-alanyl-D-alanine carboxypeptidase [Pseudomonadota bacterium]
MSTDLQHRRHGRIRGPLSQMVAVAAAIALASVNGTSALAAKTASMVVDANTGKVLHAKSSTAQRYPASLTKLMTLYVIFERIERGKLTYRSTITASARAASRPPSKIGLRPGDKISVATVVKALVVKSANDVATAVAEHISGSEPAFARLMTAKARELGMKNTVFRNASGLPDHRQVTTARDMITLALRLRDHFPKHYHNFRLTKFSYRGRRFRTHNAIVRSFPGADGMKTGYIRASGFNIVSSVQRGRKHVIAAVFGGRTARVRNRLARILLTRGLSRASVRRTRRPNLKAAPPRLIAKPRPAPRRYRVAKLSPPRPRLLRAPEPARPARTSRRSVSDPNVSLARVRRIVFFSDRHHLAPTPKVRSTSRGKPRSIEDLIKRSRVGQQPASPARRLVTRPTAHGSYQIQVGAYLSQIEAQRQLARVRITAGGVLRGSLGVTPMVEAGDRTLYRARFAGFDARRAARACEELRTQGVDCHVARVE